MRLSAESGPGQDEKTAIGISISGGLIADFPALAAMLHSNRDPAPPREALHSLSEQAGNRIFAWNDGYQGNTMRIVKALFVIVALLAWVTFLYDLGVGEGENAFNFALWGAMFTILSWLALGDNTQEEPAHH